MSLTKSLFILWAILNYCSGEMSDKYMMNFLKKYGYMPPSDGIANLKNAIMSYQSYMNMNMTGEADSATENMMKMARCGMPDKHPNKRERKWKKTDLKYDILQYSSKLTTHEVDSIIREAFDIWEKYSVLKFTRSTEKPDIKIYFSEYGLSFDPFDGPGYVLGYALVPEYGEIYFDDSENWIRKGTGEIDLFIIALHEIGHALGLRHTGLINAIMYSNYNRLSRTLHEHDIININLLYGSRKSKELIPTRSGSKSNSDSKSNSNSKSNSDPKSNIDSKSNSDSKSKIDSKSTIDSKPNTDYKTRNSFNEIQSNDLCDSSKIDTTLQTPDGRMVVFRGSNFWKFDFGKYSNKTTLESEINFAELQRFIFPSSYNEHNGRIEDKWPDLPSDLDAAYSKGNKNYFFKGDKYWLYIGSQLQDRYPRLIHLGYPGIPNNLDAATLAPNGRAIIFLKNRNMYVFSKRRAYIEEGFLDRSVNAALTVNGNILLFSNETFYHLNRPWTTHSIYCEFFGCNIKQCQRSVLPYFTKNYDDDNID